MQRLPYQRVCFLFWIASAAASASDASAISPAIIAVVASSPVCGAVSSDGADGSVDAGASVVSLSPESVTSAAPVIIVVSLDDVSVVEDVPESSLVPELRLLSVSEPVTVVLVLLASFVLPVPLPA